MSHLRTHRRALPGSVAALAPILALALPGAAWAQQWEEATPAGNYEEAQPAGDTAEAPPAGNEIVVTAAKREQTLQDVPVAVTVTTAETVERAHIRDLKDLSSLVPSLRINQLQSPANTNFYIRGFGNGANNAGIEPSVGLFVDGVYRSHSVAMIADLPDVERIEVLRGPQSTLFGKNASAGVISITTKKPQFDFGGDLEASYGNFNALVLKGVVTGPLTDTLAASLAGSFNRRDGYVKDAATGRRVNDRNRGFVRGQLLYQPGGPLSVRLIGDWGRIDELCCAGVNLRPSAATAALEALGGRVNPATQPFGDTVYYNFNSTNRIDNWGVSGQVDYALGPIRLTSITAYRSTRSLTNQDSDFTSADLLGRNDQHLGIDTFTQELRVNANFLNKVNALLGFYYYNERIRRNNGIGFGNDFRSYADLLIRGQSGGAFDVASVEGLLGALQGDPALYAGRFFGAGQGLTEAYRLKDDAFSAFAQVDVSPIDRLTLTGGISYTHDAKRYSAHVASNDVFSAIPLAAFVAPASKVIGPAAAQQLLALRPLQFLPPFLDVPNAVEPGRVSGGKFTYTARIAWAATPSVNLYLSFATGYKAASVNLSRDSRPAPGDLAAIDAAGLGLPNLTAGSRYAGPEQATVYEAGLKGNWGIATANFAIFEQSIRGFQSNIFTGTGFFLANAGKQSSFGFEFEGTVKPVPPLTLRLALTYLDPRYDSFRLSAFGDLSGTTPGGVSPLSVTFGGSYDHAFANGNHLIFYGDFHYEAPFQLVEGLPGLVVRDPVTGAVLDVGNALAIPRQWKQNVEEADASVTLAMASGLEFTVWGRNLLNDRTILQIFDSPAQQGSVSGYPNQPRTYGVSARFRW